MGFAAIVRLQTLYISNWTGKVAAFSQANFGDTVKN